MAPRARRKPTARQERELFIQLTLRSPEPLDLSAIADALFAAIVNGQLSAYQADLALRRLDEDATREDLVDLCAHRCQRISMALEVPEMPLSAWRAAVRRDLREMGL